jgi:hypothetical protein
MITSAKFHKKTGARLRAGLMISDRIRPDGFANRLFFAGLYRESQSEPSQNRIRCNRSFRRESCGKYVV